MLISFIDKTQSVKLNFLQSLVLLYLPCETFSIEDLGENKLSGEAYSVDDRYYVHLILTVSGKTVSKSEECAIDSSIKLQMKNLIGRTFLKAAEELFGYKAPFGIVTGIRPAKLAADYLSSFSEEETKRILMNEYSVNSSKADLCIRTAKNELRLTEGLDEKSCSLYISVPFCPSKCRYCSFVSSTTPKLLSLIPEYVSSLIKEISDIAKTVRQLGLKLKTIYIGGGTPAILTAEQIKMLMFNIAEAFDLRSVNEFTVEAGRPDCITKDKLVVLKNSGVHRISINTQTANNEILAAVGRKHTFEDYLNCMETAREVGISCINTDLIAGLPGETVKSFCDSIDKVISVKPENITVHAFTLKRSSEYKTAHLTNIDANSIVAQKMIEYSSKRLIDSDYEPYYMYRQKNTVGNLDNTGYSLKGYECLYNIYMMGEYHTVFAAGAGAVNKYVSRDRTRIERVFSPKFPYEFLDKSKYSGFDSSFAEYFYNKLY